MKVITAICVAILSLNMVSASAQNYPTRLVTIVVPAAAGSTADNGIRIIAKFMAAQLGQPVIIDNKPGAGGIVGMEYAARANPDGYTLAFSFAQPMALYPSLYKKLSYDPVKGFMPIRTTSKSGYVMLANPKAPYKNLKEFLQFAKENPGKINYGTPGIGSGAHLLAERLQQLTGVKMTHIPYKSATTLTTDLVAGIVDVSFDFPSTPRTLVESGQLAAFAMTSKVRIQNYPSVATFAELGYPQMDVETWGVVLAPAGTPQQIIEKLSSVVADAKRQKEVIEFYSIADSVMLDLDYVEFPAFYASEREMYRKMVEEARISLD